MAFVLVILSGRMLEASTDDSIAFFEEKIRPVLVQHCYGCHNSLGKAKGGLALDYRDALLEGGDSGEAILPGNPGESLLIQALKHQNGYEMPAQAPKLSDQVIQDFEKWVQSGAVDPRHEKPSATTTQGMPAWEKTRDERSKWWAFTPPQMPMIPKVDADQWSDSPIDRLLYHRMLQEGLAPHEEASPEVIVRRLHLILVGRLPAPHVVETFLADPSQDAYETLVDKLLASEEFGQHWARYWMDWYRYAESHGSERDPRIPYASMYRDYLIRALNDDVPYDQLILEHIAGDLLETPRVNQQMGINESAIGPAHFRMVPHGFGVTDAYGEQISYVDNQIDVISKAMLGLTVSCSRCHNHKFDPISQKDFYRFFGVLTSSRPSSVVVDSPDKANINKSEIQQVKATLRTRLAEHWKKDLSRFESWIREYKHGEDELPSLKRPIGTWVRLRDASSEEMVGALQAFQNELAKEKQQQTEAITQANFYLDFRTSEKTPPWTSNGNSSAAESSRPGVYALKTEGPQAVAAIYPGGVYSHLFSEKNAAVLSSGNFRVAGTHVYARLAGSGLQARVAIRNYPLARPGSDLHHVNEIDQTYPRWIKLNSNLKYWKGELSHFEIRTSKDGLPQPGAADKSWFGVAEFLVGDNPPAELGAPLISVVPEAKEIASTEAMVEAYQLALKESLDAWKTNQCTDVQAEFLNEFLQLGFLENSLENLPDDIRQLLIQYRKLEAEIPIPTRAPGLIEVHPRHQPLLIRGNQDQEAEPVLQGFLEVFDEEPFEASSSGRLQLANRIVSESNTLKSRVLVNRLWAAVFGRGLVASTDNFGRLGELPSHPELLDYLAVQFEKDGWSIKNAVRAMVTSQAFRRTSHPAGVDKESDPKNVFLTYFMPRRLNAEVIVDNVNSLASNDQRVIYRPVIRNELDPFLAVFNAPVPVSTVSTRSTTNVPAQALAMMNGELVMGAAKQWAKQIDASHASKHWEEKLIVMYAQAYARKPREDEIESFQEVLASTDDDRDKTFFLAYAIFNSKEFIYVY
ncbi:PSD1 and planctomycete cytochrome C domain-containing protein [Bremerella sp. JC770]|uniref:PSD1 and planctomycete cytochrome C domain-containing protein n=1 Tax=Bremerella sp. JC770 TaxID=3232137 RepID=UPI0034582A6F